MARHPAITLQEGEKFGRLVVIEFHGKDRHGHRLWRLVCECGNDALAVAHDLLAGKVRSCGCFQREHAALNDRNFASAMGKIGGRSRSLRKISACCKTLARINRSERRK